MITDRTLAYLAAAPVADEVTEKLKGLTNQRVVGETAFIDLIRNTVGEEAAEMYRSWIVESARERAVLYPVVLNPNDQQRKTEFWVKAGLTAGLGLVAPHERVNAETLLEDALRGVEREQEVRKSKEDEAGRVQITKDVLVGIASSRNAASRIKLGA